MGEKSLSSWIFLHPYNNFTSVSSCRPCNRLLHCCAQVKTQRHCYSRYKKCHLSIDRKKKDLYRGSHRGHVHTYIQTYIIIVSLCCNTSNINETKRAYCSILHMYIYILYRHWKHAVSRIVLANDFATKTSLACASILHINIAKSFARTSISIFYWREKKKRER